MRRTLLHGGDYNPEQWLGYPGIIDEDFRLMKLANINFITIGVFSWASIEQDEGRYNFEWMDDIFDRAERSEIEIILATPSGGKPHWLGNLYPETRRVRIDGKRDPQQMRHNHCLTSPVYREKVHSINTQLARRYGAHPSLLLWHVSNEYLGYCYCDLCFAAFRTWLIDRHGSLDALNLAYWAPYWSHIYTDWEQISSIDPSNHGLGLDWKSFMTAQCADFLRAEIEPLRKHSPKVEITTNFHGIDHYDYFELAKDLDVVGWDSYPQWHSAVSDGDETGVAIDTAFRFDLNRNLKNGRPFLLMESTPSQVNWHDVSPLKRPGFHRLSSLQAVAHGSDSVGYFQFRQSRGAMEKFHGAVVSHEGSEHTRVFREVSELGSMLNKLSGLPGSRTSARVAVIFDWKNLWALSQAQCCQNKHKLYRETCVAHYEPFWKRGIAVDIVDSTSDWSSYALVIAPMLYMVRGDTAERLAEFVNCGGTLVTTYQSGYVDEKDLCFLGGFPGPLRKLLGIWVEEYDALHDAKRISIEPSHGRKHGLSGTYEARHYADILHLEGAEPLATYTDAFYTGLPALTKHSYGKGQAYYAGSRNDDRFLDDFLGFLSLDLSLPRCAGTDLTDGVTASLRENETESFLFLLNFKSKLATINLGHAAWLNVENDQFQQGPVLLPGFGSMVFRSIRS